MEASQTLYYTDGHQVTISGSIFKVKKTIYKLDGITRHGFSIIYPKRMPSTLLMCLGSFGFVIGAMNFIPKSWNMIVLIGSFPLLMNYLLMAGGTLLFLFGLLVYLKSREKYAVRIFTAEGGKNVVVSRSREYISKVVEALNRAYLDLTSARQ